MGKEKREEDKGKTEEVLHTYRLPRSRNRVHSCSIDSILSKVVGSTAKNINMWRKKYTEKPNKLIKE